MCVRRAPSLDKGDCWKNFQKFVLFSVFPLVSRCMCNESFEFCSTQKKKKKKKVLKAKEGGVFFVSKRDHQIICEMRRMWHFLLF